MSLRGYCDTKNSKGVRCSKTLGHSFGHSFKRRPEDKLHTFKPDPNNKNYCKVCGQTKGSARHSKSVSAAKAHIRAARATQRG
jgi:hypothetical protein